MISFINYRVGGSREQRAGTTPDLKAWVSMGDPGHHWHAVASSNADGLRTLCNGSATYSHVVALHDNPPEDERCEACMRRVIERRFVMRGLAELVRNAEVGL